MNEKLERFKAGRSAGRAGLMRQREQVDRVVAELNTRVTRQRKLAEWQEKESLLQFKLQRKEELVRLRREMTEKILENDARVGHLEAARNERAVRRGELSAKRERLEQERANLERSLPAQRTKAMAEGRYDEIEKKARAFLSAVADYRQAAVA